MDKTKTLTSEQLHQALVFARHNLLSYSVAMQKGYQCASHHIKIAKKLHDVEQGKIRRLMIFAPPRHGKTQEVAIHFPSWFLGRNPTKNIIVATYGGSLSSDIGRKIRNSLEMDVYKAIFPHTKLADDSNSVSRFNTSLGGGVYAVGAGGSITGRGGDILLMDDIYKNREEADSPVIREKLQEWYTSTFHTRLQDSSSAIIIIMTRWRKDDLAGWILEEHAHENWDVLLLPAVNKEFTETLWPQKFNLDWARETKQTSGTRDWQALYLQQPTQDEGEIIKREWIKFYKELPASFDEKIMSCDLTFKGKETSDYVSLGIWGRKGSSCYLIDRVRSRMDFPAQIRAIRGLASKHGYLNSIVIEDAANGEAVYSSIKDEISGVVLYKPKTSKDARLQAVSPMFEAGNVWYPDPSIAPWIHDSIEELLVFPLGAHDDTVDETSMALLRLRETISSISRLDRLATL